mgnify:CR=1 FL=1
MLSILSCGKDSPETVESVITFNLTVTSSTGGKVSSSGGPFESGSNVSITATPDSEYVFVNWSNGSTDNPLSVTVNSNQTITSNFEKRKYPLTVSITGSGTVSEKIISDGKSTTEYTSGSTIQLTAVPTDGILQNFNDLNTAALATAGVCIHEYLDSGGNKFKMMIN